MIRWIPVWVTALLTGFFYPEIARFIAYTLSGGAF
jgi:hypothetical protein